MTGQESPALTPDQIRRLLRECVTVVKPGEVLIVRLAADTYPDKVYEYGRLLNTIVKDEGWDIHTLVLPAESLGVAEAPSA